MSDIVERLGDIYATDDHVRGCSGREYDCSCGYDERSAETARAAAAEITRLRGLVEEARHKAERIADMPGDGGVWSEYDSGYLDATKEAATIARALLASLTDPTRGKP